jgi:mannan endo-1,4-beta-mannosidase
MAATAQGACAGRFVRVEGSGLTVGGRPFRFLGANLQLLHDGAREAAEPTLAAAEADGLTVGRVWALGEGPADASDWARREVLFRAGPDGFIEAAYQRLDRVLAAARAHHVRLIVTLANFWGDYGGVPAYLAWVGLPSDGWGARDRFFSDARTRAFYRAHLDRLLARKNRVTGVRYVDDPTILSWELMNESRVDTDEGATARRAFIVEMARYIRARDPHHLITPGLLGYTSLKERAEWLAVCRLPEVDYCDSHLYPQGTDRVALDGASGVAAAAARLAALLDDRAQLAAHVAKKPLVLGEFGFRTDEPGFLGEPRARWFERLLERVQLDGVAGALVWIYQPWSGHTRDFGIYTDHADTDDVRAVLRQWAARLRAAPAALNPRLGAAAGEAPLFEPYQLVRRDAPAAPTRVDAAATVALRLDPGGFAAARWERLGVWDGGALAHAYGADDGWFEWRFGGVGFVPARLALRARISSEYPGSQAPRDGGSTVEVQLDGVAVGALAAVPDDGVGRVVELTVEDRALLSRLGAGEHTLRLAVAPGPRAHGLCVYGAATGRGRAPDGEIVPVELTFTR